MKKVTLALLLTSMLGAIAPVSAQEYMFTYSKLFTQMKANSKEGHDDIKIGFFFTDAKTKQLCDIEKAWMEKEEHYEELSISPAKELLVPLDSNLRQANPLVFVQTPKDKRCDFSMVVMTKVPFDGKVTYEEVEKLMPQMQTILEDLGGMFSSWFTPDVEGVTLEFANQLNSYIDLSGGQQIEIRDGKAQVALKDIGKGGFMTLPQATIRVLPYLPNAKK
ncbi:DUF2987 domain-containing protein [Vibrio sp. TRT 17S01]|uniref:DUF2987 domain-containing protein n=1 Tax=Vibrio sp. TRT 17S01 TaxID=3418505 RepID=UPI003CF15E58